ncbi:MAG: hypothetical protein JWP52_282, partial [Rhizobacter sp.]|nr:hypothetical protein [Rhizobacter sp.]
MTSSARSTLKQRLVPLLLLAAANVCCAQDTEAAPSGMSTEMRYALPAAEIIGFDFA